VLIRTRKIAEFPPVLTGTDSWAPLPAFLRDRPLARGTIDLEDLDMLTLTDSVEEAVSLIIDLGLRRFGLTYGPRPAR
jgi:predicted Rossmann-fold nucleotide-binding protein